MQRLEGGGGGQAKWGSREVPGRANRPCPERRNGTQWPEAGGSVRASLGLKMMERSNNVIQFVKYYIFDFRDGSEGKESAFNAGDTGDKSSIPPGSGDPLKRKWQPTPVFFPGQSHGQKSLAGYSLWGCKEPDMTERLNIHTQSLFQTYFMKKKPCPHSTK